MPQTIAPENLAIVEDRFSAVCIGALQELIRSAPLEALNRFEEAYSYRRSMEWLGESGIPDGVDGNTNGLTYALARALGTHVVNGAVVEVPRSQAAKGSEGPFRDELLAAAQGLTSYPNAVLRFGYGIVDRVKIEPYHEDIEGIKGFLFEGVAQYVKNHRAGTSGDPW